MNQVLSEAQQEFSTLASSDLLGISDDEKRLYFARYSLLKKLISSIESYLDEDRKMRQLENETF